MYPMLLLCHDSEGEEQRVDFNFNPEVCKNVFLLSGRDTGESSVKSGDFAGLGINEVLRRLGGEEEETRGLPIYIRHINTSSRSPVKVYPGDEYAALHSDGKGKKSLFYIVDALEGAEMVYGLSRSVSPDELNRRATSGSLSAICNFVNVQKGDVFYVPEGVVFAVGGGISAVEVSINSDNEFVIADYRRTDESGSPRPVQLTRALEVMSHKKINIAYGNIGDLTLYPFGTVRELAKTEIFSVEEINVDGNMGVYEESDSVSLIVISGEADVSYSTGTIHLKAGNSVFIPKGIRIRLSGKAQFLYTRFR